MNPSKQHDADDEAGPVPAVADRFDVESGKGDDGAFLVTSNARTGGESDEEIELDEDDIVYEDGLEDEGDLDIEPDDDRGY